MAAVAPLAIGTRGTVGSLVRREIEYFRRLEVERPVISKKLESKNYVGISKNASANSSRSKTTASLGSLLSISWRRKRRSTSSNSNSSSNNNSGSFLPSMCSAVEVSESKRFSVSGIPGFSYRNLKSNLDIE